jgi:hypothetical protein
MLGEDVFSLESEHENVHGKYEMLFHLLSKEISFPAVDYNTR